jgi:hypothetical protein
MSRSCWISASSAAVEDSVFVLLVEGLGDAFAAFAIAPASLPAPAVAAAPSLELAIPLVAAADIANVNPAQHNSKFLIPPPATEELQSSIDRTEGGARAGYGYLLPTILSAAILASAARTQIHHAARL